MNWCFQCLALKFHYFHDNGERVEGELKADENCQQCALGLRHKQTEHDKLNFNQTRYYRDS